MERVTVALLETTTTIRLGRARTLHLPRVLIVNSAVTVRTACGLGVTDDRTIESNSLPTCEACAEATP